eukprot:3765259-Rhodomonas_salina.3
MMHRSTSLLDSDANAVRKPQSRPMSLTTPTPLTAETASTLAHLIARTASWLNTGKREREKRPLGAVAGACVVRAESRKEGAYTAVLKPKERSMSLMSLSIVFGIAPMTIRSPRDCACRADRTRREREYTRMLKDMSAKTHRNRDTGTRTGIRQSRQR